MNITIPCRICTNPKEYVYDEFHLKKVKLWHSTALTVHTDQISSFQNCMKCKLEVLQAMLLNNADWPWEYATAILLTHVNNQNEHTVIHV